MNTTNCPQSTSEKIEFYRNAFKSEQHQHQAIQELIEYEREQVLEQHEQSLSQCQTT